MPKGHKITLEIERSMRAGNPKRTKRQLYGARIAALLLIGPAPPVRVSAQPARAGGGKEWCAHRKNWGGWGAASEI